MVKGCSWIQLGLESEEREYIEGLASLGAGSVAAQYYHMMLNMDIDIICLSGKLLIRPRSVKRRSNGLKRYKGLLIPPPDRCGSTAKEPLFLPYSSLRHRRSLNKGHSDILSRAIVIHHYAVYCCDVQTYKEKPSPQGYVQYNAELS